MRFSIPKSIDQFLPFGKVWEAVPPGRDCPGLAVCIYSFALDASDLQLPKLLQHRGKITTNSVLEILFFGPTPNKRTFSSYSLFDIPKRMILIRLEMEMLYGTDEFWTWSKISTTCASWSKQPKGCFRVGPGIKGEGPTQRKLPGPIFISSRFDLRPLRPGVHPGPTTTADGTP